MFNLNLLLHLELLNLLILLLLLLSRNKLGLLLLLNLLQVILMLLLKLLLFFFIECFSTLNSELDLLETNVAKLNFLLAFLSRE